MSELTNTVSASGTYDNIPTAINSNTSVVNLIDGLTLTLDADKKNWIDGTLLYTITLNNTTDKEYSNVVLTDALDTSLITLLPSTIKIGEAYATQSEYQYEESSGTLTITLGNVPDSESKTVTFEVKKKDT